MLMIETVERIATQVRTVPAAGRFGLAVMVIGATAAIGGHLLAGPHAAHHATGFDVGQAGHLVALIGMVIAWTGVVVDGARRQRRRRAVSTGGHNDAVR